MAEMVEEENLRTPKKVAGERESRPIPAALLELHSISISQSPPPPPPRPPPNPGLASRSPFSLHLVATPLPSPVKKALSSMQTYLVEVGHFTKLNPHDAWLPITESRKGNAYYSAFHTLSSGIGPPALVLTLALASLGWAWGILCLSVAFMWQLYTLWLLIQLHESRSGTRHSRYLRLAMEAFGEKLGKVLALFPTMYLSGGTCVTLIMIGSGAMKIFFEIVHGETNESLTLLEWYIVFTCSAVVLSQLPNLNSIAGVSLIGAVTAVSYCTMIWAVSVTKTRPIGITNRPVHPKSAVHEAFAVLNALGIIAFAFRGHNLVLEIQGTMPSSIKQPSREPMWRGVKFAYLVVAMTLLPLAIGGYWAYGNLIPSNGGMFTALYKYHKQDTSKVVMGSISLLVVINCLTSFQIYAMPVFDNIEFRYTSNVNKPCPWWVRVGFRVLFGCLTFFIAVALPFLPSLAGLLGGIALPITLAYPCFMWIMLRKPEKYGLVWLLNCALGMLGMILSVSVVTAAIWSIVYMGIEIHFFKPQ